MLFYESVVVSAVTYLILSGLVERIRTRPGRLSYLALALVVHTPWLLVKVRSAPPQPLVTWVAGTWVFACLVCTAIGLPLLVARLGWRYWRRVRESSRRAAGAADQSRRRLLGELALPAVALTLGGVGALGGVRDFILIRLEFRIRGWPKALDGFRIGQITDAHVGDFISTQTVAHAVDTLNAAGVDLQVMTGDLVDDLAHLESTFTALERCRAPHGMLAVLGNHEKMHHRLGPTLDAYARRRARGQIRLLVDESEVIRHNGVAVRIVGVDYPMRVNEAHSPRRAERWVLMQKSAAIAFEHAGDWQEPLICLSHHPDFFPLAARHGVRLTLSGHTHGGQIAIAGTPLFAPYDFMLGRYRLGQSHLYVSGGLGHWLPVRYGVPTEVAVVTLRSA